MRLPLPLYPAALPCGQISLDLSSKAEESVAWDLPNDFVRLGVDDLDTHHAGLRIGEELSVGMEHQAFEIEAIGRVLAREGDWSSRSVRFPDGVAFDGPNPKGGLWSIGFGGTI